MKFILMLKQGENQEEVANQAGVDVRTLRRWKDAFIAAEKQNIEGFVGLIRQVKKRGNREPRISNEMLSLIEEVISRHYKNQKRKNAHQVYGELLHQCEKRRLPPISIQAFYSILRNNYSQEMIETREGRRSAYNHGGYESLERGQERMSVRAKRVFEQCEVDHTQLDIELVSERSGLNLGRPWLTVLFDDFSRRVTGFYLTFDPPSYRSVMAVIRDMVKRFEIFPESLLVDGGERVQEYLV